MTELSDTPARKSRLIDLHRADPVETPEAFGRICAECLEHWHTNERLVLATRAMPHLHQMRVGIRRLRSAFSLFRPHLPILRQQRDVVLRLREAALPFGRARDLDVLLDGPLVESVTAAQLRQLRAEREAAYDVTLTILTSPLWRAATHDITRLIEDAVCAPATTPSLRSAASAALAKRWRTIVADGADLAALAPEKRHEVRIEAKKLRYGFEFFHSLYAASTPTHVTPDGRELVGALACGAVVEDLQSTLGLLNDHATAERLLYSVGAHAPDIVEEELVSAAQDAQRAVAELPQIWA